MAKKIGGLGKGLSAIFSENDTEDNSRVVVSLKISQIEPNRKQPRQNFDEDGLQELAQSIAIHGILQPIIVRPLIYGGYQIIAGERRYRASRIAGLTEIPAVIRELDDSETMQIALIENLQRTDLTAMEEAMGYQALIDEYGLSQEELAKTVGKSRSAVANTLRLLSLPESIRPLLNEGKLSAGHARALMTAEHNEDAEAVAQKIVKENLSVRETENLIRKLNYAAPQPEKKKVDRRKRPAAYTEVELALSEAMGTKVHVTESRERPGGTLSIEFYDPADLYLLANKIEKVWNDTNYFDSLVKESENHLEG